MSYTHLGYYQRCKIAAYWKAGYLQKEIAKEIGVSASTVSRELKRNRRWNWVYCPDQADAFYKTRRKDSKKPKIFTEDLRRIVTEKLKSEWSPEQISGYGKRHGLFQISHERIYQYILSDKASGGTLYLHLRQGKKKYRKRYGGAKRPYFIKNRVCIDERPEEVNERSRLGDWEIDTIVGKGRRDVIITLVERLSKKVLLSKVTDKKASNVANEIIDLLLPLKPHVLTITSDNGIEFRHHEKITEALGATVYFAHPYSSWERGLNENTNGLIRQYLPKKSSFAEITLNEIAEITGRLNSRPRKALGYASPDEVFNEQILVNQS